MSIESTNWELELLREQIGEDAYHAVLCELGGIRLYIPRPSKDTIIYYYKKGCNDYNRLAKVTGFSYSTVAAAIHEYLNPKSE